MLFDHIMAALSGWMSEGERWGVEARGLTAFAGAAQPSPAKTGFSIVHSPLKVMHHVNNLQPAYRILPQINSCGNTIKREEKKVEALVRSEGKIQSFKCIQHYYIKYSILYK